MYEKNNDINRRVFFVGGGMIILSSFLLSRLWKLQVSEQDKYLLLSDKNRIRITPLFPKRGIFYDRNGNELVLNSSNFKLTYSSGSALPDQVLIKKISNELSLNNDQIEKINKRIFNRKLKKLVELCMKDGLLLVYTGRESVKIGPPLTISREAINEGSKILNKNISLLFKK